MVANSNFAEVLHKKLYALCIGFRRDFDLETEFGEALHPVLIDLVLDSCLEELAHISRRLFVSLCTKCSGRNSRIAHAHFVAEKVADAPQVLRLHGESGVWFVGE